MSAIDHGPPDRFGNLIMLSSKSTSRRWSFTRPDPAGSSSQYFSRDLRQIAGQQLDKTLPWQDNLYLTYPSSEAPDWPAFVSHVKDLNRNADQHTFYKIVYVMRRAHKERDEGDGSFDPNIDNLGKKQCISLAANLERAMQTAQIPPPQVIVTSPLVRALETTRLAIAPLFPAVRPAILENLRERVTGSGRNQRHEREWIEKNYSSFDVEEVTEEDCLGKSYFGSKRRESYDAVWERVKDAFVYIYEEYPEDLVVLLVSHCGVEQTIQREITGWDVPDIKRKDAVEFYVAEAGGYAMIIKGTRS